MAARWDRHGRKSLSAQSVKEIGREKRKRSDEAIQKCYLKVKDKKRRTSGNRTKMKSSRKQSGLKKRSYWTSAMAWLQQLATRFKLVKM